MIVIRPYALFFTTLSVAACSSTDSRGNDQTIDPIEASTNDAAQSLDASEKMVDASIATHPRDATGPLRIMPLGDSITASTCYRAKLWDELVKTGHTNFNFVGTRNGGNSCSVTANYDKANEGHAGYIVSDLLKPTSTGRPAGADPTDPYDSSAKDLVTWFDGQSPDIVLMHFGTNDAWNSRDPKTVMTAYSAILGKLRANNPAVLVFVAKILPMAPSGCATCEANVEAINALVPTWAASETTSASKVIVVDQWTGFDAQTQTVDGVHPNEMGAQIVADKWYAAIQSFL